MGRKNKVSNDESEPESESEYEEEEIVPLLSVIIQDNQDVLVDMIIEYRDYDSRYNCIGVPEINKYVEDIVYLKSPYVKYNIPSVPLPYGDVSVPLPYGDVSVHIENIMYRFITDIIDTMDLEYDPIIDDEQISISDEENKRSFRVYISAINI